MTHCILSMSCEFERQAGLGKAKDAIMLQEPLSKACTQHAMVQDRDQG